MAKLISGTRVYGNLTVDSNITLGGTTIGTNSAAGNIYLDKTNGWIGFNRTAPGFVFDFRSPSDAGEILHIEGGVGTQAYFGARNSSGLNYAAGADQNYAFSGTKDTTNDYALITNGLVRANIQGSSGNVIFTQSLTVAKDVATQYLGTQEFRATASNIFVRSAMTFAGTNLYGMGKLAIGTEAPGTEAFTVLGGSALFDRDVTITGNLFVNGNLTTFNANTLLIKDPMIYMADNNTVGDTLDIGIVGSFNDSIKYQHTGFVRDHLDKTWKLFSNVVAEPSSTIDFANATYANAKFGNITSIGGTFTGNITQSGTNSYIASTITTGASAAGTGNTTAYTITTTSVQFTTVAAGTGAILPANAIPGMRIFIANDAAGPLLLYPPSGGVIDQAVANAPVVVGGLGMLEVMALTASNWTSISPDTVGTANQITVSQGNGNVVLSLPNPLIAPGYINTTANISAGGNVYSGGYHFGSGTGGAGVAGQIGIAPAYQYFNLFGNVQLANGIGDQRIFGANVFLAASTAYSFECLFDIYKNSVSGGTGSVLQFNLGSTLTGAAVPTYVGYQFWSANTPAPVTGGGSVITSTASAVLTGYSNIASNTSITISQPSTTAQHNWVTIKGSLATSTGGWISPRINYTVAPGGVSWVQAGSYMKIAAIGSGTANTIIGTWAV